MLQKLVDMQLNWVFLSLLHFLHSLPPFNSRWLTTVGTVTYLIILIHFVSSRLSCGICFAFDKGVRRYYILRNLLLFTYRIHQMVSMNGLSNSFGNTCSRTYVVRVIEKTCKLPVKKITQSNVISSLFL